MTVSTITNKIVLLANGLSNVFSFPFAVEAGAPSTIQVFLTDTSGNITQLNFGTDYTVVLNAAVSPNPTPVGGSVTLTATPANLTLVTILRTMPLTQPTSLANQGNLYQPVLEAADDDQVMQIQQVAELQGRALTVAVSDPTPTNLPPAAQRAFLFLAFDAAGNPIAAEPGGASAPVSSAMEPVVAASTIAQAVALLGLANVAPEPTGTVKLFAGSAAPTGYVLCFGQSLSTTAFPDLFAVIGYTYGGSGPNFNVPDLRGRVIFGLDNMGGVAAGRLTVTTIPNAGGPTTLGGNGGFEGITQTVGMMPSHTHIQNPHSHDFHDTALKGQQFNVTPTAGVELMEVGGSDGTPTTGTATATTQNTGGGTPTPQVQPSLGLNAIIKT